MKKNKFSIQEREKVKKAPLISEHEITDNRLTSTEKTYLFIRRKMNLKIIKHKHSLPDYIFIMWENNKNGMIQFLEENMTFFTSNQLDLHGCTADLAKVLIKFFIKFAYKKRYKSIMIIFGKGEILSQVTQKTLIDHHNITWNIGNCIITL